MTTMGYPHTFAESDPNRAALILSASGEVTTYEMLDDRSRRIAMVLRAKGISHGDHIAMLLENGSTFMEVCWAAQRSGLYYTPIGTRLTPDEAAYLIEDSDAAVLFASARVGFAPDLADTTSKAVLKLSVGGQIQGFQPLDVLVQASDPLPLREESEGNRMHYTSGTTGRPKGVLFPLRPGPMGWQGAQAAELAARYQLNEESVFLSPGPLYHAAPLGYTLASHRIGATVVVMDRFAPIEFLRTIERYRVTHVQCVPTMFVRLLALPEADRLSFDLSSLQCVIHAAAPCPVGVKEQVIEWFGPIVEEYYGGSEHFGAVRVSSEEWIQHKGSVGRDSAKLVHIVTEDGTEANQGELGLIFFENEQLVFEYYKDPEKTKRASHEHGWYTYGDIGYLDGDRFLYLTDRRDFTIISGGVNIYPQEIEDVLICHDDVADVAVFGLPDDDFGERVVAVVELHDTAEAGTALAADLIAYAGSRLARYKLPKEVFFEGKLPRAENGKLYKRGLIDRYQHLGESSNID
jgi:long-chain acyl-CoA synthetase